MIKKANLCDLYREISSLRKESERLGAIIARCVVGKHDTNLDEYILEYQTVCNRLEFLINLDITYEVLE